MNEHNPNDTLPHHESVRTQRFQPVDSERTETNEFHPDIMQFIEVLNKETYTIMASDGFVRTDLKVRQLEKSGDTWMITLFNPNNPESAIDTLRMTLGEFQAHSSREIIEK